MLIAHISDTHLKPPGKLAYGRVDTALMLKTCVEALLRLDPQPDLIVHTGDLTDLGRPEEYDHLKAILAPLKAPVLAVPGNHDERDAMRAAFAAAGYFPAQGFLHYAVERGPLRILGVDTVVPGQGGGELCAERLAWLDARLAERPVMPTVVLMHHPPFLTGIAHMDRIGLSGRDGFADIMGRHRQVEVILCGHVHRIIRASVGGRAAMIGPSPAHQVALDLSPEGPSAFMMEPPGYMLHRFANDGLVSLAAVLGTWPGPFPFFDAEGKLID
ncbi:MAG: phosphodiesterase [Bradyrhizobiaceae bacterium]|nr:phosphodiesterase [Bradyrhizobiaceae bacterium]